MDDVSLANKETPVETSASANGHVEEGISLIQHEVDCGANSESDAMQLINKHNDMDSSSLMNTRCEPPNGRLSVESQSLSKCEAPEHNSNEPPTKKLKTESEPDEAKSTEDQGNNSTESRVSQPLSPDSLAQWLKMPAPHEKPKIPGSFDWSRILSLPGAEAAPVGAFRHAPMSESWSNFCPGMKVELTNYLCDVANAHWIATVQKLAGYKALMRYEGFEEDSSKDFWVNLCSDSIHPVGWCATNKQPLVPPKTSKYRDWKDFLVTTLTGSKTLPTNFFTKVTERVEDCPLKIGQRVEIVNKYCISTMKVASLKQIVGKRVQVEYEGQMSRDMDNLFWCHAFSDVIHPVGWSQMTGHKILASAEYKNTSLQKMQSNRYDATDASPACFVKPPAASTAAGEAARVREGMKLEARDPIHLSNICPATVMKVLKHNYFMIGIDGSLLTDGSDWFCFHASSSYLFPVGFCQANNIDLTPPQNHSGTFDWNSYLQSTGAQAVPESFFTTSVATLDHGFREGLKLEAVDLMDPGLVCVATVVRVVGRLVQINFDGWDSTYDQWIDCESPDIYPVGWCELVHYRLEGPKLEDLAAKKSAPGSSKKKTRKRKSAFK